MKDTIYISCKSKNGKPYTIIGCSEGDPKLPTDTMLIFLAKCDCADRFIRSFRKESLSSYESVKVGRCAYAIDPYDVMCWLKTRLKFYGVKHRLVRHSLAKRHENFRRFLALD